MNKPSLADFLEQIAQICAQDTSSDPDGWSPENPLWGHCALVAVLIQEIFGGDTWRASLLHLPRLAHVRSHYGNRLPSGAILDATAKQFGDNFLPLLVMRASSREHMLGNAATLARFTLFRDRYLRLSLKMSRREYAVKVGAPPKEKLPVQPMHTKKITIHTVVFCSMKTGPNRPVNKKLEQLTPSILYTRCFPAVIKASERYEVAPFTIMKYLVLEYRLLSVPATFAVLYACKVIGKRM